MLRRARRVGPIPAHPYRDTAVVYGVMAVLLVLVAGLSGGDVVRAAAVAVVVFIIATAWSWWRFHERIRRHGARRLELPGNVQANGNGNGRRDGSE
jgi:hypothetical protein